MINLDAASLQTIRSIIKKYFPDTDVMVFGSRATGKAQPYSDLDLVLMNQSPIDQQALTDCRFALSDSDVAIMVDIVIWSELSNAFQTSIKEQATPLWD